VLSNCGSTTALHRYTIRHNEVLSLPIDWLKANLAAYQIIYADLPKTNILPVADLFNNYRPDIAVADSESICILELSVCHETNLVSSREFKRNKYKNIGDFGSTLAGHRKIVCYTIQISTLGFISNIHDFTKAVHIPNLSVPLKHALVSTVLKSSFDIYCSRNCASTIDAV